MPAQLFSQYLLPIAIAVITFGIGINLRFRDFKRLFKQPKAVLTGLGSQLVYLPLAAIAITWFWPIDPVEKAGFVLLAACPGGTASNLITHLLRGRVALSVSLTAVNSFVILFSVPFITNLALALYLDEARDISLPFLSTLREIGLTVLLPTVAGILFNHRFPRVVSRLEKPLRVVLPGVLLLVFLGVIFLDGQGSQRVFDAWPLLFPAFILNLAGVLGGFLLARTTGVNHAGQYTIAIEVGMQNSALAIYVASALLEQPQMAVVAVVYSTFTFFTTTLWAFLIRRFTKPARYQQPVAN